MKNLNLAGRYAKALYALTKENNSQTGLVEQLRALGEAFSSDATVSEFLNSPIVRPGDKIAALEKLTAGLKISEELKSFISILAKKDRLGIFNEIVTAYQQIEDEAHGVTRGTVRSAATLGPDDRKRIEELVSKATKKQVVLTYKEDPTLLGGLVADVGSFTLDDSLISHLNRINEQLTRSAH